MAFSMSMGSINTQVFVDGSAVEEAPRILRQDQLMLPHKYAPQKGTSACHECTKAFTTFRRKYNCQMCGEVVCRSCTVAYVAEVGKDVIDAKVCMSCVSVLEAEFQESISRSSPKSNERNTVLSTGFRQSVDDSKFSVESQLEELRVSSRSASTNDGGHSSSNLSLEGTSMISKSTPFDYVLDFDWPNPWPKPPLVENDVQRIQVLRSYPIADKEPGFDSICEFASRVLQCPVAVVSVIDDKFQRFKASLGLAQDKIPRGVSFCAHALVSKEPIVVLDTSSDARFQNNPMVTGAGILFYASAPICAPSGHVLGTVCVMDQKPRTSLDASILEALANVVVKKLENSDRLRQSGGRRSSDDKYNRISRSSSTSTRGNRTSSSGQESADEVTHLRGSNTSSSALRGESNSNDSQAFSISASDLKPQSQWVSDSKRYNCHVCSQKFSIFLRKHHCRLCGEVICKNCAMSTVLVKGDSTKKTIRVSACLACLSSRANSSHKTEALMAEVERKREVAHANYPTSSNHQTIPLMERPSAVINDDEINDVIPVLQRNQSYDVDTSHAMYTNNQLILEPQQNVLPTRDFTQQEIQSMLVRLLSQSNDIQQQLSHVTPSTPPDRMFSR